MKQLDMTPFEQDYGCCAVAASAIVANYYDSEIDYKKAKSLTLKRVCRKVADKGLETSQIGTLLNLLGFQKVTIISSDLDLLDYTWKNLNRKRMIDILEKSVVESKKRDKKYSAKLMIKWLGNLRYNNKLIIDYNFGKYIRKHLDKNKPVIIVYNWTIYHKAPKEGKNGPDVFNGKEECHAVVISGYDDKGVYIIDSNYRPSKRKKNSYKMSWENLMTCMGTGDVILADKYGKYN
jgi:hypothetical protein